MAIDTERLLILQTGFLGDAVLASGMLRYLAGAVPHAEIGLVVRAEFGDLFEGHPAVAYLHRFDKRASGGTARLARELQAATYTTAFLPHRSLRTAVIARRAGIPRRIGFRQSDAPWLLTDRVEYRLSLHETERNAMLLGRAGIRGNPEHLHPWLVPVPAALAEARGRFAGETAGHVVIAPGSVWPTKRWAADGFVGLARALRSAGHMPLLVGSPGERQLCEQIAASAGLGPDAVLAGELSLPQLLAVIACADRVVTNDSAPLHLAESVGTPVTAIFGPTVPEFGFGPRGKHSVAVGPGQMPCRPCGIHGGKRCPLGTHACMNAVTVPMVLAAMGMP